MKKVLIISGHPELKNSYANRLILDELKRKIPSATIRFLDVLYPNFHIDVPAEQTQLVEADIIVWQFPFYWYSVPDLMKRWMDQVLLHGFAYGSKGIFLQGKKAILSFTVGGKEAEYAHGAEMHHPVEDFIVPLKETIRFCRMEYAGAVYSAGMTFVEGISPNEKLAEVKKKANEHAAQVAELISRVSETQ